MNKNFDLNHQYSLYLDRIGLSEKSMHPIQKIETKRAFMGACGQMLLLLRDELAALPDAEAVTSMQDMIDQVGKFWIKETNQQN